MRCARNDKMAAVLMVTGIYLISAMSSDAAAIYTSIEEGKCSAAPGDVLAQYQVRGLDAEECHGYKGWRLFIVSTPERSWIDLRYGRQTWSTERVVVHENTYGHFPNIGGTAVEWGTTTRGVPSSIIFRIDAQGIGKEGIMDTNTSRYYAIKLNQDRPTFCGLAMTNEEARVLATGKCDKPLKKIMSDDKTSGN